VNGDAEIAGLDIVNCEVVNWMVFFLFFFVCVFFLFSSSRVFCHCIVFCLPLSVCLFAIHVANKDLYIGGRVCKSEL